jgi:hypothetical protein
MICDLYHRVQRISTLQIVCVISRVGILYMRGVAMCIRVYVSSWHEDGSWMAGNVVMNVECAYTLSSPIYPVHLCVLHTHVDLEDVGKIFLT